MGPLLIVACVWMLVVVLNLLVGSKARRESGGSWARLLWVSARLACLQVLPAAICGAFAAIGRVSDGQVEFALLATIISVTLAVPYLQPPVRLVNSRHTLPPVEDQAFLARIAELAGKMGVSTPFVRWWPSINGSQQALAFAGALQAPQLVVTDGIMHRLSPVERDAIVAHELAHVANNSLWLFAAIAPLCCAAATASTVFYPNALASSLGFFLFVGLRRLTSRVVEYDCDRRAAQVIGFRETATALAKIHALHPIPNTGLISLLAYATATHPPRELRLAALCDEPVEGVGDDTAAFFRKVRTHRRAGLAALLVWVVLLAGALFAGAILPEIAFWLALLLMVAAATPTVLVQLAIRRQQSMARRRLGEFSPWVKFSLVVAVLTVIMVACSVLWVVYAAPWTPSSWFIAAPAWIIVALMVPGSFYVLRRNTAQRLRHKVRCALQVHDFVGAIELGQARPRIAARDHTVRYNLALARAVLGEQDAAIAELEQLWADKPRFPLTALLLAELLLEAERSEQALEVARNVAARLPHDPAPYILQACALRRVGRLDDAEAACREAALIEPADAGVLGVSAALALDRSDYPRAQELIAQGLQVAPGDCYLQIVQAECALATQPLPQARLLVEQALAALRATPLAFLQADARRLEERARACTV